MGLAGQGVSDAPGSGKAGSSGLRLGLSGEAEEGEALSLEPEPELPHVIRSRCEVPECPNVVELTRKGNERRFCRKHRTFAAMNELVQEQPHSERGSTRRFIGEVINEPDVKEKIRRLINRALELRGLEWGYCPKCKGRVRAEVADIKGRVTSLVLLLQEAEGKPQQAEEGGLTIVVERPAR